MYIPDRMHILSILKLNITYICMNVCMCMCYGHARALCIRAYKKLSITFLHMIKNIYLYLHVKY